MRNTADQTSAFSNCFLEKIFLLESLCPVFRPSLWEMCIEKTVQRVGELLLQLTFHYANSHTKTLYEGVRIYTESLLTGKTPETKDAMLSYLHRLQLSQDLPIPLPFFSVDLYRGNSAFCDSRIYILVIRCVYTEMVYLFMVVLRIHSILTI